MDVIEAGFPIASEGDFEAVQGHCRRRPRRGRRRPRPGVPGRHHPRGAPPSRGPTGRASTPSSPPATSTFSYKLRKSRAQVLDEAVEAVRLARRYVDDVEFSAEDATRTDLQYLSAVTAAVVAAGATHGEHPRHGRLLHPRRVRRAGRPPGGRGRPRRGDQRPLPQRPGPGRRQLARGGPGRRPAGGVHRQRHRRAGRQLRARGDRDGVERPAGCRPVRHRRQHPAALPGQPAPQQPDHIRSAAEQGDRRARTPSRTRPASTRTAS